MPPISASPATTSPHHSPRTGSSRGNASGEAAATSAAWRRWLFSTTRPGPDHIHAISGAAAGLISGLVTCPLDVVKTKLQAQGGWVRSQPWRLDAGGGIGRAAADAMRYRGLIGTTRLIIKEDGFRGLYRGVGPLIMGYLPTWTVYFVVYERARKIFDPLIDQRMLVNVGSAVMAGASSTMATNPIWVVKTRLMSQASADATNPMVSSPYHYRNTWDAFRKMYRHEGLLSFYSGLGPALLGLTHVAVQFPLYEYLKFKFTGEEELGQRLREGNSPIRHFAGLLAASMLSKITASTATYPHEVLRTRLQTQRILHGHASKSGVVRDSPYPQYRGILHSVATIYREEGWRAFYAGMGTNMIRAVPASAITLMSYEFTKRYLSPVIAS